MNERPLVLAIALLCSCVPVPNRRRHAPKITGRVVRDGIPMAGAAVVLSASFTKKTSSAETKADGTFTVGPLTELHLSKRLLGDPLTIFRLSVKTAGEAAFVCYETRAMGPPPDEATVECDAGPRR